MVQTVRPVILRLRGSGLSFVETRRFQFYYCLSFGLVHLYLLGSFLVLFVFWSTRRIIEKKGKNDKYTTKRKRVGTKLNI